MRVMAEAVINPVQVNGTVGMSNGPTPSPSYVSSFRIFSDIDRLLVHIRAGSRNDNNEISSLCISLSRGIDNAVDNNEHPIRAPDLPSLLKQVCQWKSDTSLQAAIMVLMLSIKGACRNGWFSEKDNEELHNLFNEIASSFCSVRDMNSVESTFHHSISTVMSRFFPRMQMGEILAFVEATPGYGAFVKDFHITKSARSPDKIYLFVAQMDNTETSSCIISPQLANFLLNGRAVDRRTCVHKDPGPQTPTLVTHMLKYGTNLLQALGQFDGKYIIVVAFMCMISNPSYPALPDYVPPAAAAPDLDNDIVEGPSRISLNCPISFTRIKTPVKGHLCKHLQCFDFDNYVDINSRRPSWRCPHCSHSVCFGDIRIDQSMAKILKEVGMNISHVKIYAGGSWEAISDGDDDTNTPQEKLPLLQESTTSQDVGGVDIMDLTAGDNDMNDSNRKPSPATVQDQPNVNFMVTDTVLNAFSQGQSQVYAYTNTQLATPAIGTSHTRSNGMTTPVTHTVLNPTYVYASKDTHLQQFNSNNMSNEYRRYPTPTSRITRIPNAVQALPVQTSARTVSGDRQQEVSRFHMHHRQMFHMISARPSPHTGSQNWVHQGCSHASSQPVQQFGDYLNSHQYQSLRPPAQLSPQGVVAPTTGFGSNQQYHMPATQQPMQIRSRTQSFSTQVQTCGSSMPVTSSSQEQRGQGQGQGQSQSQSVGEGYDAAADQNWRPTGRMRGSLSGRAYSEALNQFIILPTQPVQAARPPVLNTPRPVIPPHLQALVANNRNAHAPQDGANGSVWDSRNGDGTGILPDN